MRTFEMNEQIEEMQFIMLNTFDKIYICTGDVKANADKRYLKEAEALYKAGYRKQEDVDGWKEIAETYQQMFENARTDVTREIFAEIEKCFCGRLIWCPEATILDEVMFTELKEKYGV